MVTTDGRYLLVVSITNGRNFPARNGKQLVIDGKFNDELLSSDPVQHTSAPQINTELAWELDKKALHHHKMQRTPIKLNIYTLSESGEQREPIGYLVLDLRSAATKHHMGKWFPLLSNKYTKFKCELNVQLALEEEGEETVNNVVATQKLPGKLTIEKREINGRPFLQVGRGGQMYIFSVSITHGKDLIKLLPANRRVNGGFYWYYQLRGNDVMHEPFHDLQNDFPTERASLNIQGSKGALSRFIISEVNPIEIHLCHDEQSLASTTIDFGSSFDEQLKSARVETEPLRISRAYPLKPNPSLGGGPGAEVTVSISLRGENVPQTPIASLAYDAPMPTGSKPLPLPKVANDYDTDHGIDEIEKMLSEPSTTDTHLLVQAVPSHFSMSIELLSLRLTNIHQCSVYLKYSYPFFGSSKPIFSGAPVPVQMKSQEVKFSEPFCQFDFACIQSALETQFRTVPLVMEVWTRSSDDPDQCVGSVILPVERLLPANEKPKVISDTLAVASSNKLVGQLHVKFWLENKGPIKQQVILPPKPAPSDQIKSDYDAATKQMAAQQEQLQKMQFKTALELELWKTDQEEQFMGQLKQKEKDLLTRVSKEFAQRETERESLMNRRITEYEKMEKQLRKALLEAKKGETRVLEQERELGRLRDDMQTEKDRIRQDAKTAFEQQKRELNGLLKVERAKTTAAEERTRQYRLEGDESSEKYKIILNELESSKRTMPDPHLQAEIKGLLIEKGEFEKRIETLQKAKSHYKQQWSRAIRELALSKEREQESALARVKRQQEELEQMRLKYITNQEQKHIAVERETLKSMKSELLNTQKSVQAINHKQIEIEGKINQFGSMSQRYKGPEYATRLIEEKEQLLKSGVYSETDRIIQEINQQIRDACVG